jgi:hypothetical protein
VTIDLHLIVCPSDEFQLAALTPAHQIPRAVHAAAIRGEWILEEAFRRKLRPIEVTLGYARAADV